MNQTLRQRPALNKDNQFFFDALTEGKICAQQCSSCNEFRHPPVPMCPHCHSLDWRATEMGSTGELVMYTVVHHPVIPPFAKGYIVGLVELEHGVRLVMNLEYDESEVEIGQEVEVRPVQYDDDLVLPAGFKPGAPSRIVSSTESVTDDDKAKGVSP